MKSNFEQFLKSLIVIGFFCLNESFADEATYTYAVDSVLMQKKWVLIGGEINNNLICPPKRIVLNEALIASMLQTPYVKYSQKSYDFNDGCNGGGGKMVYDKYLAIALGGGSSTVFCNFMENDTLKAISNAFVKIIMNNSFVIFNDTLMLQNSNGRIFLKKM